MDVKLPKLGEGSETGVVVSILVKVGDTVTKGQTLLELENEKSVAPIPSTASGIVQRVNVKEGDKVGVGSILISVAVEGENTASPSPTPSTPSTSESVQHTDNSKTTPKYAPEPTPPIAVDPSHGAIINPSPAAAPSVRKIARELGIDLTRIRGTESGGRIVMADLRAHIDRLQKLAFAPKAIPGRGQSTPAESIDFAQWGVVTRKPLTTLRKVIGRRMCENWTSIPHVTQFDEFDITSTLALRKEFAPAYEAKGARLTLTPLIIKALVSTLKQHPIFNASIDEVLEEVVVKNYYHIGIAVDTEAGLFVPVIRDADTKSLLELSSDLETLATKARDRKVSADELKGGTFTISNQGAIGGSHFTPIVNKPEVAILGLGRSTLKPTVVENRIEARMLLPVALSYDHRLIDGGAAARFIVDLQRNLANLTPADLKLV